MTGLPVSQEKRVFDSILGAIGDTPLVKLGRIGRDLPVPLYAKLEFMNPGGSVKDRVGANIIEGAEKRKELKPGGTIVEATSGNTGVGLAIAAALKGYKTIFVMPDKMSNEKILLLRAYGAKVVSLPRQSLQTISARITRWRKNLHAKLPMQSWQINITIPIIQKRMS